ncbi:SNO glutamine amidotransferase family-domain-containing protein [Lanmaoa asiatica]|nr:SNO glutamine amidotransferase family-domain-containing protein [Lanmaoa asiatica]
MQDKVVIGILGNSSSALQGAFAEHETALRKITSPVKVHPLLVRTPDDLAKCDGLIIPGGGKCHVVQSMYLFLTLCRIDDDRPSSQARRASAATQRVHQDKTDLGYLRRCDPPGTDYRKSQKGWTRVIEWNDHHCCTQWLGFAGLLSQCVIAQLEVDFGRQVDSFEAPLTVEGLQNSHNTFTGIFIRAPVIKAISSSPDQPPIRVIARLPLGIVPKSEAITPKLDNEDDPRRIVAVQQGNHLLTTFHPELTKDGRFHEYFVRACSNMNIDFISCTKPRNFDRPPVWINGSTADETNSIWCNRRSIARPGILVHTILLTFRILRLIRKSRVTECVQPTFNENNPVTSMPSTASRPSHPHHATMIIVWVGPE